ncbi:EamA family transporter [Gordonibacter sp. ResAG-26]|uniref:EamA family transporter n=2 Tax=Gordonibacter urolithinfaciens TaxID=1335613 RepID=A0A6N8IGE1_9ACTN|nr:EamA family transporter [Gordonibacter urolithinfaciens]MVN14898.1 EamA family transporter [Gordonibacter urolithinfaciens]MVN40299.1 EamA family transporter [Gordonibacter urolithinfaciens]MVN57562.1 EamA family transporter [Gordonibacter urolithinfaciens]MVN62961.1 EamA family transporter [Gordonibacter urolithinfaciens]
MASMQKNILKYSALVFAGGASYGIMATTVKFALADGFQWTQVAASQPLFGTLLFAVALAVLALAGKRPVHLSPCSVLRLLGLGLTTCTTCVLYNFALTRLSVAVAITLLFQFTWIGVVIQIVVTRRRPSTAELAAAAIILGGTLLASGLFSEGAGAMDPLGVVCGLLSAVSTALFMFLSGRIGVDLPPIQRGLFVCLGACILGFAVCPGYFASGALQAGIWKYGLVLGAFGLLIPVVLFGIGTPHLPTGLSTIMASSELPCGILISVFVLGEPVSTLQAVGVVVILAGVVVSQLPNLLPAKTGVLEDAR